MRRGNTKESLVADFVALGLRPGTIVMVHSSLGRIGWTEGGPLAVITGLLDVLGLDGTLAMPAESPQLADPAGQDVFDPPTTPTTMGAIPEAFRSCAGTRRSHHPLVSVCANGRHAREITAEHALEFCEGRGTPFECRKDERAKRADDIEGRQAKQQRTAQRHLPGERSEHSCISCLLQCDDAHAGANACGNWRVPLSLERRVIER
jgi:hypothetical protein